MITRRLNETAYIGIDPGAVGAIAVISKGIVPTLFDMPVIKVKRKGGTKSVFNYSEIVDIFKRLCQSYTEIRVCLEQSQVQVKGKGSNAYTGFRVGVSYGIWPLFLAHLMIPVEEVAPVVWKRKMGLLGKDKEAARHKAMSMFPHASLKRKKDHGRAEALLLAEYLRREHNQ